MKAKATRLWVTNTYYAQRNIPQLRLIVGLSRRTLDYANPDSRSRRLRGITGRINGAQQPWFFRSSVLERPDAMPQAYTPTGQP